jgi:hypothetical protein
MLACMSVTFIRGERVNERNGERWLLFRAECSRCGRWASMPVNPSACVSQRDVESFIERLKKRLERRGCGHCAEVTSPPPLATRN